MNIQGGSIHHYSFNVTLRNLVLARSPISFLTIKPFFMKLDQSFMAQLIQTLTNQYGGRLSIRRREGRIEVIKTADMSKRILSEKQRWVNSDMITANKYAKTVLENEKMKADAQLRLNVSSKRLYHSLIGEWFQIEQGKKENPYKNEMLGNLSESQINQASNGGEEISKNGSTDLPGSDVQ